MTAIVVPISDDVESASVPGQEEVLQMVEQQSPKNVAVEETHKEIYTREQSEIVQPMFPPTEHLRQSNVMRCVEDSSISEAEELMKRYVAEAYN